MNDGKDGNNPGSEPFELPIDGVLDLHTFRPADVMGVVTDYLAECRARGILEVRIIHGKGIGQLRQTTTSMEFLLFSAQRKVCPISMNS